MLRLLPPGILLVTILLSYPGEGSEWWKNEAFLKRNPIFAQIVSIRPQIDKNYALNLSNVIHEVSTEYGLDKRVYTAILAQESMFKQKATSCKSGMDNLGNVVKVCFDFGISQIHFRTILRYGLDKDKILRDLEYAIDAGGKVLYDMKRQYSRREPNRWWTRFNCGTKPNVMRQTCRDYYIKVSRFL